MNTGDDRINQEWIALNAIRGMVKIASKGSMSKSTYDNALDLGGVLYPELLGPDNSLLRRERESDTTKEGANKRGNSSRLTQSFHFFMFEPIFSPVNALNQPI
ncbi:hypothetical protein [Edwardsiella anguillarum]|uniref:hypothetical protein n=1 Tax=Edwardsiella anguillarum TaxID=1821960 RepID=UPI00056EDE7F|nr:hypothetical protein [Edwardsiella anguillarum]